MSHLKKALEKAGKDGSLLLRESRTEAWETPESVPSQEAASESPLSAKQVPDTGGAYDSKPNYVQTRSVETDQEHLVGNRVFSILPKNRIADQYKLLRTMLLNRTRPFGHNTIAVTSFKEEEGKSLTAVNLSIIMARESRQTVLLVDADLRKPSVHQIMGIPGKPGLKDYLLHHKPLEQLLVHPDIETLTVLPAGGRLDNSTELMGSVLMEELVREIKHRYPDRYVVFDCPALSNCPDALVLSAYIDGMVLVARADYTTGDELMKCMDMLKGRNVIGVVLNGGEVRKEWAY
ncbi:MAG: polysaccharide biosynthesis tyrosine autokinase [Deltaproteobacteria bacterium]|nr:polysaccharide biosynthesis tyrosine autokinase [Deltaproteobacteria bacterium]